MPCGAAIGICELAFHVDRFCCLLRYIDKQDGVSLVFLHIVLQPNGYG